MSWLFMRFLSASPCMPFVEHWYASLNLGPCILPYLRGVGQGNKAALWDLPFQFPFAVCSQAHPGSLASQYSQCQ